MNVKLFGIAVAGVAFQCTANALDDMEQIEMVKAHNKYRSQVGVPEIIWSNKLSAMAQAYANKLRNNRACQLLHSDTSGVGENLFWASAMTYSSGETRVQEVTPQQVTEYWGSEREDYTYSNNSCARGTDCGHYTQMVWRNMSEIGCAKAICDDDSQVWVCHYYPAGNYVGEKPY